MCLIDLQVATSLSGPCSRVPVRDEKEQFPDQVHAVAVALVRRGCRMYSPDSVEDEIDMR